MLRLRQGQPEGALLPPTPGDKSSPRREQRRSVRLADAGAACARLTSNTTLRARYVQLRCETLLSALFHAEKRTPSSLDLNVSSGIVSIHFPVPPQSCLSGAVEAEWSGTIRQFKILLVEDDGLIRALVADFLREKGFEITEAEAGDEAIALLDQRSFDLVYSDVDLHGALDGLDIAAYARSKCPTLPVLITSGLESELTARLAALGPAAVFVRKPYRLTQVLEALGHLLSE